MSGKQQGGHTDKFNLQEDTMDRRRFLTTSARILVAGFFLPSFPIECFAKSQNSHPLSFYNLHTGEKLEISYSPKRGCPAKTHHKLNEFLRDFRTDQVHPIDTDLLGILSRVQVLCGSSGVFEVISGYRCPATNRLLRRRSSGVARHSLHMKGKAIDIRLTDAPIWKIRHYAVLLRTGGVGYYPRSDFVHLDTGRFRTW